MAEDRATRRLAAILSADMVGYSRLMEADEAGTLAALKRHRVELIDPKIAQFGGRIVGTGGDSLLCEFASVVDAVQCAIDIQTAMTERNADLPEERRMQLRIGINLGDVIVEGADIFGDGVNVAARLEALAAPGGVCVSGTVREHAATKLPYAFEDMGDQTVKNMARPVHAWRIRPAVSSAPGATALVDVPVPPDKPSIAVLPFTNISGDPEQEYFADGITEDLITALSKIRWFFVIARNSTFVYKGRSVDIKDVGRQLGVRYVLEGSVRKAGNSIRISAQLIEAAGNRHVWAERYDRDIGDIFTLQDEMTAMIVTAIEPELGNAERELAMRRPPDNLDAWSLYQRALWHNYRFTEADLQLAKKYFKEAIAADPKFAQAYAGLAHNCYWMGLFGIAADLAGTLNEGLELARHAVSLDDEEPMGHFAMGRVQTLRRQYDSALSEFRRAIDLNASFAHAHYGLGWALTLYGRPEEALSSMDTALRLNPRDPLIFTYYSGRSVALLFVGRAEEAAEAAWRSTRGGMTNFYLPHCFEAAVLVQLGRDREAAAAIARALEINPAVTLDFVRARLPIEDPTHHELFFSSLAKAGLPTS